MSCGHARGLYGPLRLDPGQKVKAGQKIGRAGFANAWHCHFAVNSRRDDRGVGDRDPDPFLDYARRASN